MSGPAGFDVRAYLRDLYDLRPAQFGLPAPTDLSPAAPDVLEHLRCAERGLLDRVRDVLVTPTHAETRVTAFLGSWAYEQHWLAETLGAVLEANGRAARDPGDSPRGRVRRGWDERVGPTVGAVAGNQLGADVTAARMVVGRLDAVVLTLAHRELGALDPRPAPLARAAVRLKERHVAFYTEEATTRLAAGGSARRITRAAMSRWRWPGTRYAGPGPAAASVRHLLADPARRAALLELDHDVAALPGLGGVRPVRTALARLTGG